MSLLTLKELNDNFVVLELTINFHINIKLQTKNNLT